MILNNRISMPIVSISLNDEILKQIDNYNLQWDFQVDQMQ